MYYVYILKCADGSLYTGITNDPKRRLAEHKSKRGGSYTRTHGALRMLYKEIHKDRSSALKREVAIKRWRRARKLALIRSRGRTPRR